MLTDFIGRPISIGDAIVYATGSSSSARMSAAVVLDIKEVPRQRYQGEAYYDYKISVGRYEGPLSGLKVRKSTIQTPSRIIVLTEQQINECSGDNSYSFNSRCLQELWEDFRNGRVRT